MTYRYFADDLLMFMEGHQSSESRPTGLRPTRLGHQALQRVPTSAMRLVVDAAAGVRIRFRTTANRVELVGTFWKLHFDGVPGWPPPMLDVVTDTLTTSHNVDRGAKAVLDPLDDSVCYTSEVRTSVTIDLSGQEQLVELWLPQNAVCDLLELTSDAPLTPDADNRPVWVHHGSSISHCFEAASPTRTWPALVAKTCGLNLQNLGFAGSALVDPFVARQIRDMSADIVSLKLGINVVNANSMQMRSFLPAVDGFVDTIRETHRETPLLLVSPIVCPAVETRPGPTGLGDDGTCCSLAHPDASPDSATLVSIRRGLKGLVGRRKDDSFLTYVDGLTLFSERHIEQGMLPDGLHPNTAGYEEMARNFVSILNQSRLTPA